MLVLSRKVDQEVIVDGNIRIRVLQIKGNTIRLGIEAPSDVHIVRSELEKKDSRTAENLPKPKNADANFSIVFDAQAQESPIDVGPDRLPIIAFENPEVTNRLKKVVTPGCEDKPSSASSSVEYRGKLPEVFHRNRLQEIVDRMTSNN